MSAPVTKWSCRLFGNPEVAQAVSLAGAVPVFADIDPVTYCLDASAVEAAVTPRTVAAVVVHRFGRSADIASLRQVGQRHGLLLLEQGESETPYSELGSVGGRPRTSVRS